MRVVRRGLEQFIEIFRERREPLLVVRLASKPRDSNVVRRGLGWARAETSAPDASHRNQGGPSPPSPFRRIHFHRRSARQNKQHRLPPVGFSPPMAETPEAKACARKTSHTTPHFRRSNHSAEGKTSSSRKTMGIFHNSFASRTVMPASE